MIGLTDLLIYLDEALTKNLNALVINGYIEKRTSRWIEDRTLSGGVRLDDKEQSYEEDRCIRDERDGYKGKNFNQADTLTNTTERIESLDGRRFIRREEELTRIYTTFELHQQLINGLNDSNLLKTVSDEWMNDDISVGDYILVNGTIGCESVQSYVDAYCNLLNSIGTCNLNSLLKSTSSEVVNYDASLNYLTYLKNTLSSNNTQDIIVNTKNNDIVVMINNQYLFNNYGNIYDRSGCSCKIVGKVVRVCEENECIHLLRKTGQPYYHEEILKSNILQNQILKSNNIIVPNEPKFKVDGKTLLIIPISMSI